MEKLVLMAGGHEIWLEGAKANGNDVEIMLGFGHNMKIDGHLDPRRISPAVYAPDGGKIIPDLASKSDHHIVTFKGETAGYYVPVVDLSPVVLSNTKDEGHKLGPKHMYKDAVYAGAFHQMAKSIVPVGDAGDYKAQHLHGIFDILPDAAHLTVGEDIELTLLYEGLPVSGVDVKAVSKEEGKDAVTKKTDNNGIVRMPVGSEGVWMFLARHRDPSKAVEDEFDETVFVTTLVMQTART